MEKLTRKATYCACCRVFFSHMGRGKWKIPLFSHEGEYVSLPGGDSPALRGQNSNCLGGSGDRWLDHIGWTISGGWRGSTSRPVSGGSCLGQIFWVPWKGAAKSLCISKDITLHPGASYSPCAPDAPRAYNVNSSSWCESPASLGLDKAPLCREVQDAAWRSSP